MSTTPEALDAILTWCVTERGPSGERTLTGDQALALAETANRFFVQNGRPPAEFLRLRAVRKAGL